MILKCVDGPMDGAVYCLSRQTIDADQRSTNRKPDGLWFNGTDEHGREVHHEYKQTGLEDRPGKYGMNLIYTYDGPVVETGIEFETNGEA